MLRVANHCIAFPPLGGQGDIFYDETCAKILQVNDSDTDSHLQVKIYSKPQSGSADRVAERELRIQRRTTSSEAIVAMKLCPSCKVIAVQHDISSVCFITIPETNGQPCVFVQTARGKTTRVIGFEWVSQDHFVFITNNGLELYQVLVEKLTVKPLKAHNVNLNWFVFSHQLNIFLASSGSLGNIIHPFFFQNSSFVRLPKFEVELCANPSPPRLMLLDRDLTLCVLYEQVCALVLRHNPRPNSQGAEIIVYQLSRDAAVLPRKTQVLVLGCSGRFAVHVVDSLILVHEQSRRSTFAFDIGIDTASSASAKQFVYPQQALLTTEISGAGSDVEVELYSPAWAVFQPSAIVDAQLGLVLRLELNLDLAQDHFTSDMDLLMFLLRRSNSARNVLKVLGEVIETASLQLSEISVLFHRLARVDARKRYHFQTMVEQRSVCNDVFICIFSNPNLSDAQLTFLADCILEYVTAIELCTNSQASLNLYDTLLQTLLRSRHYLRLSQLLIHRIIPDSKSIAFQLLSKAAQHPPCFQWAVDMLQRIESGRNAVVEVLLAKDHVLEALRYAANSVSDGIVDEPMRFVEAAYLIKCDVTFYAVFRFFEQQSQRLKGTSMFSAGDEFNTYLDHYHQLLEREERRPMGEAVITASQSVNGAV